MPNTSNYGLHTPVDTDIGTSAFEDTTNTNILDAAAGSVFKLNSAQANEESWFVVNAVSTAGIWQYKAGAAARAFQYKAADASMNMYAVAAGSAGGTITWGTPIFTMTAAGIITVAGAIQPSTGGIDLGVTLTNAFRNLFLGSYSQSTTNGSTLLPNGFIMNFGTVSIVTSGGSGSTVVAFNTVFPSVALNASLTLQNGNANVTNAITTLSTTSMTSFLTTQTNSTFTCYWQALGY